MNRMNLRKDLRKVGASEIETEKLSDIAKSLSSIKPRGLSKEAKKRLAPDPKAAKSPKAWQWPALGASFATACMLLIVAQGALPGSWLYGLKRGTEGARTLVQPEYKDNLVDKREDEVEALKLKKADAAVVEKAEEEYKKSVNKRVERNKDSDQKKEYRPRYDWSREWWQQRVEGQTRGWRQIRLDR